MSYCLPGSFAHGISQTRILESVVLPVQSLGREDLLEEDMATHSNILAWRIPWTEEADGPQSMGSQRVGMIEVT